MADIPASTWSQTDASNDTASPEGAPEGMAPGGVNNTIRMMMGAIKRWFAWSIPATTAGTTTAYTLSYTVAPGALVDGMTHLVQFNATCGASPTLNVNSLGAKPLHKFASGSWGVCAAGDLVANSIHRVTYNSSAGTYRITSSAGSIGAIFAAANNAFTGNNTFAGTSTFNGAVTAAGATTVTGNFTATAGTNSYTGTIGSASVGTTQSAGDNSTKLATTAYTDVTRVAGARVTNTLSADVDLDNTGNYFTGPSCAQGSTGTWFASGTVTVEDTGATGAEFFAKLWDGTTVIASAVGGAPTSTVPTSISLSGYLATPAGNIRISVRDSTAVTGKIRFNSSGNSKDSTLSVIRVA